MSAADTLAPALTAADALSEAAARLRAAGIPAPRFEARLLIAHGLGVGAEQVIGHPERALSAGERARIAALVTARAARRPLAQVTGKREFWSLEFEVTAHTLDPRPDSECLVAAALAHVPDRGAPLRVLDLGTGTGCLLLAVLSELPNATGTGVDISTEAVTVARRNAARLGMEARARFVTGDWGAGIEGPFDLILANPPYIPAGDLARLEPEVAEFEPRAALDGGADGLDAYRAMLPGLARLLGERGMAVAEIGAGQKEAVVGLVDNSGLGLCAIARDLGGRARGLMLEKAAGKAG